MKIRKLHNYRSQTEKEDFQLWLELIRRGVQAYGQRRTNSATIYFRSALDIAVLRSSSKSNELFSAKQIIDSATLIINVMILKERFNFALAVINEISKLEFLPKLDVTIANFLAQQYEKVEMAERDSLSAPNQQPAMDWRAKTLQD